MVGTGLIWLLRVQAVINTLINVNVSYKAVNFLTS